MEKDLYQEGELAIRMEAEDVIVMYKGKGGSVEVKIEGEYLLDKLAEAIPGDIDDTILDILKAALKG